MAFDFSAVKAPFRMQPGLRRLAPGAAQLTPNGVGDRALREKLAVLFDFWPTALLRSPGFDAAPALQALAAHAAREHPDAFQAFADGRWLAPRLGWALDGHLPLRLHAHAPPEIGACLAALPAEWRRTALLCLAFAEDFAVIDGATAHIPWLAVCLPSGWAPEEKIGRHFAEVHAPVADNETLLAASAHLARLVTGGEAWERFVWTITAHPRLHAHPARTEPSPWPVSASAAELATQARFRTERQTFVPLPAAGQAVFTIHVELNPLSTAAGHPPHARQLHDALASMSPAVLGYRGLAPARDRLLSWLDSQAG